MDFTEIRIRSGSKSPVTTLKDQPEISELAGHLWPVISGLTGFFSHRQEAGLAFDSRGLGILPENGQ